MVRGAERGKGKGSRNDLPRYFKGKGREIAVERHRSATPKQEGGKGKKKL